MALAWDGLDDDGWDDEYLAGLLSAGPADPLPATILERLAASRPRWQAQAACRGAGVDFFDPGQVDAAQALCGACGGAEECGRFGQAEPAGTWGGRTRGLPRPRPPTATREVTSPSRDNGNGRVRETRALALPPSPRAPAAPEREPERAPAVCADCGEQPVAWAGRCRRCYHRARRRAAGIQPRRQGRTVGTCAGCGEERTIEGASLCQRCYSTGRRRARGAKPKQVGKRVAACEGCGTVGPIYCVGRCARCYGALRRERKRRSMVDH